jgi:hypothetical protein
MGRRPQQPGSIALTELAAAADQRELVVCLDPADRHLLEEVKVRRWRARPLEDPDPEGCDLLLFQVSHNLGFLRRAEALPAAAWARARSGHGRVVFDASKEGKLHNPETSLALHGLLERMGVPPERAVYATQDRQYEGDYAAWRQGLGLPHGMTVVVYDYWLRRLLAGYEESGRKALKQRWAAFRERLPGRERRFLSLNNTPRPARLMVMLRMMRSGLWDQGFISFGGFEQMVGRKGKDFEALRQQFLSFRGFEDEAAALEPWLDRLSACGPLPLGRITTRDAPLPEYGLSWFSVVTESEMRARPTRITEKSLKPLLNFHPMLVFGNPGSLQMLRDLGFASFPELVDESYDAEPDPRRRFELAWAELERLCALDEAELARAVAGLQDKLLANAEHGLVRLPLVFRDRIDAELVERLLGAMR